LGLQVKNNINLKIRKNELEWDIQIYENNLELIKNQLDLMYNNKFQKFQFQVIKISVILLIQIKIV